MWVDLLAWILGNYHALPDTFYRCKIYVDFTLATIFLIPRWNWYDLDIFFIEHLLVTVQSNAILNDASLLVKATEWLQQACLWLWWLSGDIHAKFEGISCKF